MMLLVRIASQLRVDDLSLAVSNLVFVIFLPLYAGFLLVYAADVESLWTQLPRRESLSRGDTWHGPAHPWRSFFFNRPGNADAIRRSNSRHLRWASRRRRVSEVTRFRSMIRCAITRQTYNAERDEENEVRSTM